jgi:hypothetical protein
MVKNPDGTILYSNMTLTNGTSNYSMSGTALLANTSSLPTGAVTATVSSMSYATITVEYTINGTTQINENFTLIPPGAYIKVLNENSLSPIKWWKLWMTNSSASGSGYTTQLTVGKGYPGIAYTDLLDDNLDTAIVNSNSNFTYNFGYTLATFQIVYGITGANTSSNNISVKAWNNVAGRFVNIWNSTGLGNTNKTTSTFTIDNRPGNNSIYGDLFSTCSGYYCPLFSLEMQSDGSSQISVYEVQLISPYTYDENGFAFINYTTFQVVTGTSRFVFESPLISNPNNNYGLRTYFITPGITSYSTLTAYLNSLCYIQQFSVIENNPLISGNPTPIPNALISIYRQYESELKVVDQQKSDYTGIARLCVEAGFPYTLTASATGYYPQSVSDEVFSNAGLYYLKLSKIPFMLNYTNPFDLILMLNPYSIVINNVSTDFTCTALVPYENAVRSFFIVNATFNYTTYPYVLNMSEYPPIYSNMSLPFGLSNATSVVYYNLSSDSKSGNIFTITINKTGIYDLYCGITYIPVNDTSAYPITSPLTSVIMFRVYFEEKSPIAPAGAYLLRYISPAAVYIVGLIIDMIISGWFVVRFGVRSGFIFILIWGLILQIFGGWGMNIQTGVFAAGILFWVTLIFFPYRRD